MRPLESTEVAGSQQGKTIGALMHSNHLYKYIRAGAASQSLPVWLRGAG
jgi:hypothetical protein